MQFNSPIYLSKLVLENIRSFSQRQEINLLDCNGHPAQWTLIVGDNGVGKTTLLQCLVYMCPIFNPPTEKDAEDIPNLVEPLVGEEDNDVLDALVRSNENVTAYLEAQFLFEVPLKTGLAQHNDSISTYLSITRSSGLLTEIDYGGNLPERLHQYDQIKEPLILAYGAGRHPRTNHDDKVTIDNPTGSLFEVEAALHDAEDLLYRLEFASLKGDNNAKNLLDRLTRMIAVILPDVNLPENIEVLGPPTPVSSSDNTGVQIKTSYGRVPFSQLSLGYKTVFAWTLDIAWRLLNRYPDSDNPLHEPAIVIVDEIDLHLHPNWQRNIRNHLTGHFPNVQFITTAHSPLMVQSSLSTNIAVLKKFNDHTEIQNDPDIIQNWRLDQVITSDLFGFSSARPIEVENQMDRRRTLIKKKKLTKEEEVELAKLNQTANELPTAESHEDQNAMDIIRRAAEILENNDEAS